jgi:hypothetical protein
VGASDPSKHIADGGVASIKRVAGEPTSARYRCHFPAQCRPGVALAKVGQVVSHLVWTIWYGNQAARQAPNREMLPVCGVSSHGRGRVGRDKVIVGSLTRAGPCVSGYNRIAAGGSGRKLCRDELCRRLLRRPHGKMLPTTAPHLNLR